MFSAVIAGIALVMALDSLYDLFESFTVKEVLRELLFLFYWLFIFLWSVSECLV